MRGEEVKQLKVIMLINYLKPGFWNQEKSFAFICLMVMCLVSIFLYSLYLESAEILKYEGGSF